MVTATGSIEHNDVSHRLDRIEALLIELVDHVGCRWASVRELAEVLGVHEITIRRAVASGRIESKRIGRRILVRAFAPKQSRAEG